MVAACRHTIAPARIKKWKGEREREAVRTPGKSCAGARRRDKLPSYKFVPPFIPEWLDEPEREKEESSRVDELEVPRPSGSLIYHLFPASRGSGNQKEPAGCSAGGADFFFSASAYVTPKAPSRTHALVPASTAKRAFTPRYN